MTDEETKIQLCRSPSLQRKTLEQKLNLDKEAAEQKLNLEKETYDNTWTSCCLKMDRRASIYFSQLAVVIFVMLFAVYQLLTISDCEKSGPYMGLLTLLLGYVLPSPLGGAPRNKSPGG